MRTLSAVRLAFLMLPALFLAHHAAAETLRGTVVDAKESSIVLRPAEGQKSFEIRVPEGARFENASGLDDIAAGDEVVVDANRASNGAWNALSIERVAEPGVWDRIREAAGTRQADPEDAWLDERKGYEQKLADRTEDISRRMDDVQKERAKLTEELDKLKSDRSRVQNALGEVRAARSEEQWTQVRDKTDAALDEMDTRETPDWEGEKEKYRGKLDERLAFIEQRIRDNEKELDNGNPARREQLNEQLRDLERERDDVKQKLTEISATTAVRWINLKSDIDDFFKDLKD